MRVGLIGAAIAAAFVVSAALPAAVPLSAQTAPAYKPDPNLNPDDQLAPSQLAQPVPPAVAEPGAPPKTPKKHLPAAAAAPTPSGPPAHAPKASSYRTVIACSGPFAKDSGMLALAVAYDSRNLAFEERTVQGTKVGVTVLFPKDSRRRLEVWWQNANRTGTYLIDIADKSIWTGPEGLKLGLNLLQLEKLNKKPFKLSGFDKDDLATVTDWGGGVLASIPGGCKAGVTLHAPHKTDASDELPAADHYNSDDPAVRALKPTVSEILIGY